MKLNIVDRIYNGDYKSLYLNLRSGVCLIDKQCPDGEWDNVFFGIVIEWPIPAGKSLKTGDLDDLAGLLQCILDSAYVVDGEVIGTPDADAIASVAEYIG